MRWPWMSKRRHEREMDALMHTLACEHLADLSEGQKRMHIWLDDQVPPDREYGPWDAWFMNAESLLQLVKLGVVTFIHFDHDLGPGMNGYELAKEIERLSRDNAVGKIEWNIHSGNPIGAGRIAAAMQKAGEFWSAYA